MKKNLLVLLSCSLLLVGCEEPDYEAWAQENGYVKEAEVDHEAWANSNGYVKAEDYNIEADAISSATQTGVGGLNMGTVEWTDQVKKDAIKEYLKGDASTLYESGFNHRNMFSIATAYNNVPVIGSVEFAMNDDFSFTGGSEKNTEKLNAIQSNPNVSLYWTRQFRDEDGMPSYFYSYGVEVKGQAVVYDWTKKASELTAEIAQVRNYFKSMGASYGKFFDETNAKYLNDEALVTYMASSNTVYYKVVPSKIIITSPYMLFMMKQGTAYVVMNTSTNQWVPYTFVSTTLLDEMYELVQAKYPGTPLMNGLQLAAALNGMLKTNYASDGLKTQAVLEFNK